MNKIIFRADGNSLMGLGHLYRVFSLVEMLKADYEFVFVTKENSTHDVIPNEYFLQIIPDNISISDEPLWLNNNFIADNSIIIADGYRFKSTYQKQVKEYGFKLVYIDDLMTEHMYADIVVNHSLGVVSENYIKEDYTSFAFGTDFSLLRPMFLELAKQKRNLNIIDSAFVCFGGSDSLDLTNKVVKALLKIEQFSNIHIVLGGAYKQKEIFGLADCNNKINIHQNISELELINVMLSCNFAIVSASTILYEVCSVKMPVLAGYYVENQIKLYNEVAKQNIIFKGGDFSEYTVFKFQEKIKMFIENETTQKYIEKQGEFFDGESKKRFLGLINGLNITVRKAIDKDVLDVYNWSNDPLVRRNSYNSQKIVLSDHKEWFFKKIKDENVLFLIIEINNKSAGVVRFDININSSIVGASLSDLYRGQKLSSKILIKASEYYFKTYSVPILAYIKSENISSVKAFEKAGYKMISKEEVNKIDSFVYKLERNEIR